MLNSYQAHFFAYDDGLYFRTMNAETITQSVRFRQKESNIYKNNNIQEDVTNEKKNRYTYVTVAIDFGSRRLRKGRNEKGRKKRGSIGGGGVVISSYYIVTAQVSVGMLYGSYSYEGANFGLLKRALLLIIAWVWIAALFNFIPNIKIPVFSDLGKGTFSVFLVHGFIQRWIKKRAFFNQEPRNNFILALCVSAFIVLLFGNKYFSKMFDYVIRGRMFKEKKVMNEAKIAVGMERAS